MHNEVWGCAEILPNAQTCFGSGICLLCICGNHFHISMPCGLITYWYYSEKLHVGTGQSRPCKFLYLLFAVNIYILRPVAIIFFIIQLHSVEYK